MQKHHFSPPFPPLCLHFLAAGIPGCNNFCLICKVAFLWCSPKWVFKSLLKLLDNAHANLHWGLRYLRALDPPVTYQPSLIINFKFLRIPFEPKYFFIATIIFTTLLCYYLLLRPSDLSVDTFSMIIAIALADQKPVLARVKKSPKQSQNYF